MFYTSSTSFLLAINLDSPFSGLMSSMDYWETYYRSNDVDSGASRSICYDGFPPNFGGCSPGPSYAYTYGEATASSSAASVLSFPLTSSIRAAENHRRQMDKAVDSRSDIGEESEPTPGSVNCHF